MIYIYNTFRSSGARELAAWITEHGRKALRSFRLAGLQKPDRIVNWGGHLGPIAVQLVGEEHVLNPRIVRNKYKELQILTKAGLNTVPSSLTPKEGWLARKFRHQEANDLRAHLVVGDYYVEYVPTIREFRVHIFNGNSIRVALKVPRTNNPDTKFRSWSGGWKFSYGHDAQSLITNHVRVAARKAVAVMGYDFGAVDIGMTADGKLVVFEVNSAPGLEGGTIRVYGEKILTWAA